MNDVWPKIQEEREACAATFETLRPEQWTTPSLCSGWTVRDLSGHMIAAAEMTFGSFYANFAKAGFRFNVMAGRDAERASAGDTADLGPRLARHAAGPNHPPGPVVAMLGEAVVHGEDIRRPLGIARSVPEASLVTVANFYKNSNLLLGTKNRIAGVRLKATDASWSHGEGPEVSGPMLSLVLAMTGRKVALGDLNGEGVAILEGRK